MNAHVPDALVTDFEELIPSLVLPDPDDRHVWAVAIHGRADVIVTKNLKHFPAAALAKFGIEAQHPDEFVVHLVNLAPDYRLRSRSASPAEPQTPAENGR